MKLIFFNLIAIGLGFLILCVVLAYEDFIEEVRYIEWRIPVIEPIVMRKMINEGYPTHSRQVKYHTEQRPYTEKVKIIKYK